MPEKSGFLPENLVFLPDSSQKSNLQRPFIPPLRLVPHHVGQGIPVPHLGPLKGLAVMEIECFGRKLGFEVINFVLAEAGRNDIFGWVFPVGEGQELVVIGQD